MPETRIIKLESSHYNSWVRLYKKYAEFYEYKVTNKSLSKTWSWLNDDNHPLKGIIAKKNEMLVGFAHYRAMPSPLDGCDAGFLDDLYLLPEYRGEKIGEFLIQRIKKEAKEKNWPYVSWITKDDNYRARTLYDRIATKTDWNVYELSID